MKEEELDAAIYDWPNYGNEGGFGCDGAMKQELRRVHGFYKCPGR